MTATEGKPPKATRGLRDVVEELYEISTALWSTNALRGVEIKTCARKLESLLPALEAAIHEGQPVPLSLQSPYCEKHHIAMRLYFYDRPGGPAGNGWSCSMCVAERQIAPPPASESELGNLKTAREIAQVILGEFDAVVSKLVSMLISQAVAQARVDELERTRLNVGMLLRAYPMEQRSVLTAIDEHLADLKRDLAAIAKP